MAIGLADRLFLVGRAEILLESNGAIVQSASLEIRHARARRRAFRLSLSAYVAILAWPLLATPPWALGAGLDPSWQFGLTLAHLDGMTFGRDIVFTFGPWGYTMIGAPDERVWLSTYALHALAPACFVISIVCALRSTQAPFQRALLVVGLPLVVLYGGGFDYMLLFAVVALLTSPLGIDPRRGLLIGALAGSIAAVGCLTKLTLGFDVLLGAGAFFAVRCFDRHPRRRRGALAGLVALCIVPAVVVSAAFRFNVHDIAAYLSGSAQITLGYSEAMTIAGPRIDLVWALLDALAFGVVALMLVRERRADVAALLVVVAALAWKHGFVRQDAHIVIFFLCVAVLATLGASALRRRLSIAWGSTIALAAAVFSIVIYVRTVAPPPPDYYFGVRLAANVAYLLQPHAQTAAAAAATRVALEADRLPPSIAQGLAGRTVATYPSEIGRIVANDLAWRPEPVFQAYSSYTPALDRLDQDALVAHGADRVLYSFQSIDNRWPFADEPATHSELVCRYRATTPLLDGGPTGPFTVLARTSGTCTTRTLATVEHPAVGAPVPVPSAAGGATFVRAHIALRKTTLAKLMTAAWRLPPVFLRFVYQDGYSTDYRIVLATANDGIIVDPAPRNALEANAFLARRLPSQLRSIAVIASKPGMISIDAIRFEALTRQNAPVAASDRNRS